MQTMYLKKSTSITLFDDIDLEKVRPRRWIGLINPKTGKTYAAMEIELSNGKTTFILLHRFILGLTSRNKLVVRHEDGNKLNNQRHNLTILTYSESHTYR